MGRLLTDHYFLFNNLAAERRIIDQIGHTLRLWLDWILGHRTDLRLVLWADRGLILVISYSLKLVLWLKCQCLRVLTLVNLLCVDVLSSHGGHTRISTHNHVLKSEDKQIRLWYEQIGAFIHRLFQIMNALRMFANLITSVLLFDRDRVLYQYLKIWNFDLFFRGCRGFFLNFAFCRGWLLFVRNHRFCVSVPVFRGRLGNLERVLDDNHLLGLGFETETGSHTETSFFDHLADGFHADCWGELLCFSRRSWKRRNLCKFSKSQHIINPQISLNIQGCPHPKLTQNHFWYRHSTILHIRAFIHKFRPSCQKSIDIDCPYLTSIHKCILIKSDRGHSPSMTLQYVLFTQNLHVINNGCSVI